MLDIQVEFVDKIAGRNFMHSPDVYASDPSIFIDEILPDLSEREREYIKVSHGGLLIPLQDSSGNRFGRAALQVLEEEAFKQSLMHKSISVGGFLYARGDGLRVPYIGVIKGKSEQASRDFANASIPADVVASWATKQASLIDQRRFLSGSLMSAAEHVISCGGDPGTLPYVFATGKLQKYSDLLRTLDQHSDIHIPLHNPYGNSFQTVSHAILTSEYFEVTMLETVIVLGEATVNLINEQVAYAILKQGRTTITIGDINFNGGSLAQFYELVKRVWSLEPAVHVRGMQLFQKITYSMPPAKWTLCFSRKV